MEFKLKKPCSACPWRSDRHPFFGKDERGHARAQELADSHTRTFHLFPCHKTTDWDDEGNQIAHQRTQACAGVMTTMLQGDDPSAPMQVAERLGMFDPSVLDMDQPTYGSLDEWVTAHDPEAP